MINMVARMTIYLPNGGGTLSIMSSIIRIKPHHFVDIIRAVGNGQVVWEPHHYGHDLHKVAGQIVAHRNAILEIEIGADDICEPCAYNSDGRCRDVIDTSFRPQAPRSKQEWNLLVDRRWCRVLTLAAGDHISARQFCERLREHLARVPEVYLELPSEHVASRTAELRQGITKYLNDHTSDEESR
jgi:hypothetical protein